MILVVSLTLYVLPSGQTKVDIVVVRCVDHFRVNFVSRAIVVQNKIVVSCLVLVWIVHNEVEALIRLIIR